MAGIINSSVLLPAGVMGGGGGVKAGGPQTKRWRGREGTSLDGGALPPFSRLLDWRSPRLGWEGGAQVRKLWSQSSPVHIHSAGRLLGISGGPGPSTHLSLTNGSLLKLCKPGATRPPPPTSSANSRFPEHQRAPWIQEAGVEPQGRSAGASIRETPWLKF